MDKCCGCFLSLFGSKQRKRLRYLVRYQDDNARNVGVEFENILNDTDVTASYGSRTNFITNEEREFLSLRQYDRIVEEQRKVDEQINHKRFEAEEALVNLDENEAFIEAQHEAARAASFTLSLRERSASIEHVAGNSSNNHSSQTLEEMEDDFEDFLEGVRKRSLEFRGQLTSLSPTDTSRVAPIADVRGSCGGDGMSSDDEILSVGSTLNKSPAVVAGSQLPLRHATHPSSSAAVTSPFERRLEPVGNVGSKASEVDSQISREEDDVTNGLMKAERMFSIDDDGIDDEMGDFVQG